MVPRRALRCLWLAAALAALRGADATAIGEVATVRSLLEEIVTGAIEKQCPSAEAEETRELRTLSRIRAVLKEELAESNQYCHPESERPDWHCTCPTGFIACAGGCFGRLHRAVPYEEAERQCAALGARLAVPRSSQQNLCVAGLAAHKDVWLGVTDREQEGVFVAADGRPVTSSDGHVWSQGQPDNHAGKEHCVALWAPRQTIRFGEWNDYPCTVTHVYPMCQHP